MSGELRELVKQLRSRIQGPPEQPWVPGVEFHDGELVAALERAEKALAMDTRGEVKLDLTVRVTDVAASLQELFGGHAEQIIGSPVPKHDYRFNIVHPAGGRIVFDRHATAADVVNYARRMGWVRGESS